MCIRSSVQATAMGKWLDVRSEAVIRPGGGPAVRAALFANVSSPVSAVLLLGFFPSSFSLIVFFFLLFCQSCPEPRVGKDLHLHITTLLCSFVDCHRSSAWHLIWRWSVLACLRSVLLSRLHLRAVLFGSLRWSSDSRIQEVPFSVFFLYFGQIKNYIREICSFEDFKAKTTGTKKERGSKLIFYFTHHHWREDSRNALCCLEGGKKKTLSLVGVN